MNIISAFFLFLVLSLYIFATCHIIYSILKLKTGFRTWQIWVILLPLIGPMIYFSYKNYKSKTKTYGARILRDRNLTADK